jgi:hypothetical protein
MSEAGAVYRCPTAARWLPRALAAALLAAILVTALSVDPQGVLATWSRAFRGALAVAGAAAALWIVRRGGELRREVRVLDDALEFRDGKRLDRLPYADVAVLEFANSFGVGRSWLPALMVLDRKGRAWRVPSLIEAGDRLVGELLERAGRSDLEAWAAARNIERKMAATTLLVRGGG